jgi:hypothetical protein
LKRRFDADVTVVFHRGGESLFNQVCARSLSRALKL